MEAASVAKDSEPATSDSRRAAALARPAWRGLIALAAMGVVAIACAMTVDIPVAAWMHTLELAPWLRDLLRIIRLPGDYTFTVLLALFIVARYRHRIFFAVNLLIVTAIASGVAAILKWGFGRNRPFKGLPAFEWSPFPAINSQSQFGALLSFPSGDTTLAFATAAMFTRAFPRSAPVAYGWAVAVAVTRVVQRAHYPSDVTAGALLGILIAYLLAPRIAAYRGWPKMLTPPPSAAD